MWHFPRPVYSIFGMSIPAYHSSQAIMARGTPALGFNPMTASMTSIQLRIVPWIYAITIDSITPDMEHAELKGYGSSTLPNDRATVRMGLIL